MDYHQKLLCPSCHSDDRFLVRAVVERVWNRHGYQPQLSQGPGPTQDSECRCLACGHIGPLLAFMRRYTVYIMNRSGEVIREVEKDSLESARLFLGGEVIRLKPGQWVIIEEN